MKKRKTVCLLLLLLGLMSGCFSKNEEQASKPSQAPVQKTAETNPEPTDIDRDTPIETKEQKPVVQSTAPAQEANNGSTPPVETPVETSKNTGPTVTVEQVSGKYKQELTRLRGYYAGQLQSLYGGALSDLKAGQASKQAIFAKYANKGRAIQEESQAKVNQVLARMKQELQAHQLPTDKVNEYRSTYYAELDGAKNEAMAQVKKALGM